MKLIEELKTKYAINTLSGELSEILAKAQDGEEIDIAGIKFGPKCSELINRQCSRLNFVNTEDAKLNEILLYNKSVFENPEPEYTEINMFNVMKKLNPDVMSETMISTANDIKVLYKMLESGKCYSLECPIGYSENKRSAITIILMALCEGKKDVSFYVWKYVKFLFMMVRSSWNMANVSHDEYYYLDDSSGLNIVHKENGLFYDCYGRGYDERTFITNNQVIPVHIPYNKEDKEFGGIIKRAWSELLSKKEESGYSIWSKLELRR